MSKTKSGRHRLSKTDKRLLAALVVAGYEERTARDLIQKHVYTLTQADLRHLVSEISKRCGTVTGLRCDLPGETHSSRP